MATFEKRRNKDGSISHRAKIRRPNYPVLTATFDTKAEAKAWANERESEIDKGTAPSVFASRAEAERTTLSVALDRYEKEYTAKKKGALQERTRIRAWQKHPLALRSLASIRGKDMDAYKTTRLQEGVSSDTVRLELAVISHLFTVAKKAWGLESLQNPVSNIIRPRPSKPRNRRFEGDEEERLLAAAAEHKNRYLKPAIEFAVATTMRMGELLRLQWAYINFEHRIAHLPDTKPGTHRDVPLSSHALAILTSLPQPHEGRVFPVSPRRFSEAYRQARMAAEIDGLRFHDLRHEATSRLFERGDLETMDVAHITGHKSLQMLMRYTHLRAKRLAQKLG
jgi:integrase